MDPIEETTAISSMLRIPASLQFLTLDEVSERLFAPPAPVEPTRSEAELEVLKEAYIADRIEEALESSWNMRSGTSHYGESLDSTAMLSWAKKSAETMFYNYESNKDIYYVLCYRGMSGIVAATNLSNALTVLEVPHGKCYVRKEEEKSHGNQVERANLPSSQYMPTFVFVDDFIDSGDTLVETMAKIQDFFRMKIAPATIVMALSNHDDGKLESAQIRVSRLGQRLEEKWDEMIVKIREDSLESWEAKLRYEAAYPGCTSW